MMMLNYAVTTSPPHNLPILKHTNNNKLFGAAVFVSWGWQG